MDKVLFSLLILGPVYSIPVPDGVRFPSKREERKLEPVITPPILPVLEHLERDPSTLLPNERTRSVGAKPRFGFNSGFSVRPSGSGGLTASVSSSAGGAGSSHSASQSFSFGFNQGLSASHSASQSSSFASGFGSGFSGSQASSQSASFAGNSASAAASSAAALAGAGLAGSQSSSSSFGFNGNNGFNGFNPYNGNNFKPLPSEISGEGLLDIRHRGGAGAFVFPGPSSRGRAAVTKTIKNGKDTDWVALLVSD